ncbi:MAG: IS1380 family transposase [Novibacillus thermophilus]|jgi:hypothetical protein|uniref:IS1380 family transposase n=1 Tax=Novibacillus thermophilus TaxID=1471761 RepID=A0A1U9KBG1_9BACL|nr:IS1380 family transposase [Novibacillus thermophilus]TMZ69515.1 IS1380 family transposase [Klebsiella pneumoniae]AQS57323.1 IS1380 family transposase [Novibacillus thermophilus]AQS57335.1 IS1380 family transposase [Novibacillus thermophilus]AQS57370.1 IS1380 family transposase [Novibacillus thermophilus]AQS57456.1 IS1380 family transposase [Novibacillus thermophilus]
MKTEFTLKNATSHAGSKPLLAYLEKIKLEDAFRQIGCGKGRNTLFPFFKILMYLLVGWLLGCERIFHFRSLRDDSLVRRFLGGRCPHHTLLYKELCRAAVSMPTIRRDLKALNLDLITPCLSDECILDLDSTVETVYGNQEGAEVGTNAQKPGRKSFQPLIAFEGKSRLYLNAELRSGNTHCSRNAHTFAKETLQRLPKSCKVKYARFDKGFGGETFYSFWEGKQIGYVGKLKWTHRLAKEVAKCPHWKRYVDGDVIIEGLCLVYKATSWKKARMVVVIRKAERYDGDQLQFDFLWDYEAIVTNLDWEPIDIWRFYNQRACMENYIKEVKHGFSIHRIPTDSFKANEIDLLLKLLAYNVFERFKMDCCEPVHRRYTIARFRKEFFHVPGTIIYRSRQVILKIAAAFQNEYSWRRMEERVVLLQ